MAPISHITTRSHIQIALDQDGRFISAQAVEKDQPKIIIPATENSAGRTSAPCAHPLCDQLAYLVPRGSKKAGLYLAILEDWTNSPFGHPMLKPILTYVKSGTILTDLSSAEVIQLNSDGTPKEEKLMVRWIVNGLGPEASGECWKNKALMDAYIRYYITTSGPTAAKKPNRKTRKNKKEDNIMSILQNKIDFVAFVSATMANPNGDPLNGNSPRTDYTGFGEISDVCIKRKLRNRMQDLGKCVFVQSPEHDGFDSCPHLKERATKTLGEIDPKHLDVAAKTACETWLDVRSFGQVFALSGGKKKKSSEDEGSNSVSIGIRGPVSIHQAVSISSVQVADMQITKCVNGDEPKAGSSRSTDTMGMKHFVRFGLYKIKGSINVQSAERTGFTEEDAEVLKECLRTLFINDASSARPDGSMEVVKLYWFRHNCKVGQHSSAKVHRSVQAKLIDEEKLPSCVEDYQFTLEPLAGLEPEILDGV